ncbi:hypothetical protein [Pseudomonas schmalbachii]|uniref:Uncharacterized protein n=1 Tax=Pseudomonas schmalbachii TaxID=2816993 RepID=A0ABS3TM07_9PSED|nr:hypothetical protein [Pseudomonas schmalbachii]MBO3274702.1 hypothetical protein [Pseudomonas schmalbachii]
MIVKVLQITSTRPSRGGQLAIWTQYNKKPQTMVSTRERGRYSYKYVSTTATGEMIFWKANPDYIKATGAKEYR